MRAEEAPSALRGSVSKSDGGCRRSGPATSRTRGSAKTSESACFQGRRRFKMAKAIHRQRLIGNMPEFVHHYVPAGTLSEGIFTLNRRRRIFFREFRYQPSTVSAPGINTWCSGDDPGEHADGAVAAMSGEASDPLSRVSFRSLAPAVRRDWNGPAINF